MRAGLKSAPIRADCNAVSVISGIRAAVTLQSYRGALTARNNEVALNTCENSYWNDYTRPKLERETNEWFISF